MTIDWNNYAKKGKEDNEINYFIKILNDNKNLVIEKIDKIREDKKFNNLNDSEINYEIKQTLKEICNEKYFFSDKCIIERACSKFQEAIIIFFEKRDNQKVICEFFIDNGYNLYKIFKALEEINQSVIINVKYEVLEIYCINKSRTHLMILFLDIQNSKYKCYKPRKIEIDLKKFNNLLRCKKLDSICTSLTFQEDIIFIELKSRKTLNKIKRSTKNFSVSTEIYNNFKNLMNLKYLGSFKLVKSNFKYLISHLGILSEDTKLYFTKNELIFTESYQDDSCQIKWTDQDNYDMKNLDLITVSFSIDILRKLFYFLNDEKTLLKFYVDFDKPIKITFKLSKNLKCVFFLAQRE